MLFDIVMKGYGITILKSEDNDGIFVLITTESLWPESCLEFYANSKAELEAQLNDFFLSL
jgi:hypothetical protein